MRDVPALALRLLTARPTPAEDDAWRRPPYPTPAGLAADETAVRELLAAVPAAHDDDPTALAPLPASRPFAEQRRLVLRPSRRFEPTATVVLLVAGGLLAPGDVEPLVAAAAPDPVIAATLRRAVVLAHLAAGDVDAALAAGPALDDAAFVAVRDVGEHHARRGDSAAFFSLWKAYAAGRERHGTERLKHALVRGVAEHAGWEAALAVTADRRIGPAFAADAFGPWAATGDVPGLLAAFAPGGPAAGGLPDLDELGVLVDALVAAAPPAPLTDVDGVGTVFARLRAVDPTTDRATMRRRDLLLSRLWPALGEAATLAEVRRAVRTPSLRRELTVLPREVRGREVSG